MLCSAAMAPGSVSKSRTRLRGRFASALSLLHCVACHARDDLPKQTEADTEIVVADRVATVALFPAHDPETDSYALHYMRLDVPDPLSTLDVLIEGRWEPSRLSDSDGRFVAIVGEGACRYVDFGVDPPAIHDFGIDGFGPLLLTHSWILAVSDGALGLRLWRIPIEPDGSPGPAQLVTPASSVDYAGVYVQHPSNTLVSADESTLLLTALYMVDLDDPSESPILFGDSLLPGYTSLPFPIGHLTPDGGEALLPKGENGLGYSEWWVDLDGDQIPQPLGYVNIEMNDDGRTGLHFDDDVVSWFEIGEDELTITPIDVPAIEHIHYVDSTQQIVLHVASEGGSVRIGPVHGPWYYVLGSAVGEAPVAEIVPAGNEYFLVHYGAQPPYEVVLVRIVEGEVTERTTMFSGMQERVSWEPFRDHAIFHGGYLPLFDGQRLVARYDNPAGSLTALSPLLPDIGKYYDHVYTPDGASMLQPSGTHYYFTDVSAPGEARLIDLDGAEVWARPYVAPFEREYD
jgi:hypothetical protein